MTFAANIRSWYSSIWPSLLIGKAKKWDTIYPELDITLPFSTMNRHGLIAGATGTGKTKTLQKIIEWCSYAGIPTIMMDMKWDISGLAMSGEPSEKISTRLENLGNPTWTPTGFPSEYYTLSDEACIPLRATVSEFGPILFSRLLELNDTQASVMALIFQYCDHHGLLLIDLTDVKKTLQYLSWEGKSEIESEYGMISTATVGTIMRKIVELESQWAWQFFGEPSFDVVDFLRTDETGKWYVNIIRLMDMMMKPKLFSTFMLSVLTEIYTTFPEVWDREKPKLILIIDEAHLIFESMSPSLLSQLEMIMKLIRSKWVGIFFCTQNPIDIPSSILSQLGLKVQHALRAFTARDREAIEKASENFPLTEDYDIADTLTTLGIGEAFVTTLDERGIPTPLVQTVIIPPESRMDILTPSELESLTSVSPLQAKYRSSLNRESAAEILTQKVEKKLQIQSENTPSIYEEAGWKIVKNVSATLAAELGRTIGKSVGGRTGWTIWAQIARGVLGAIFGGR